MSRAGRIARRGFLIGSVAIAGGVAFGVWQARRNLPNPLTPGAGEAALTPYVLVAPEGITVIVPRAEMGQGVHTTLAMLVAEEMDLEPDGFTVAHGPAAQAYYNAALTALGMPFPDYALTAFQERIIEASAVGPKMLGLQVTGGSTSTIDAFEKMRAAGAAARETLKAAAAARLGIAAGRLTTEAGAVVAPDGTRLPYPTLAAEAAGLDVPADPPLRPSSAWRLLGKAQPRTDMRAKVTGTARYGVDMRLPGLLHAAVRMNPHLGGAMNGFDASAARAMPGVEAIVDLGTGVAAVAGNTWSAMKAVEAIAVDWGPAPYPGTTAEMEARIDAAFATRPNSRLRNDGDAAAAFEAAGEANRLEASYSVPFLAHSCMEPMNATALFEAGKLTLWTGTQVPSLAVMKAASAAGVKQADVTLHTLPMGGGFGRRLETDVVEQAARIAAALPGRPVKLTWSREEDMTHDFYRPATRARLRGVHEGGRITALETRIASPSITRQAMARIAGLPGMGPDRAVVDGAFDQPYAISNFLVAGHLADLAVPIGFWRSVGNSASAFFQECFLDELARAAGRDPLELRLELTRDEHPASHAVLAAVGEMSGWGGPKPADTGRGLAFTHSFGTACAQVVEVAETGSGLRITRAWCAADVGVALDPALVEAQMVSGMIYGLSAAVAGAITFEDGQVQERNFPDYDALRMNNTPAISVRVMGSGGRLGGAGEPGTPPAAPALANAVFDLTGKRLRDLPLDRHIAFA